MTGTRVGSVMDAFRNLVTGTTPAATAVTPPVKTPATVAENKTVPTGEPGTAGPVTVTTATEGDANPFDKFADLWQTDPKAKPAARLNPKFEIDPAKIMDAVKGQNFSAAINKEALAKAAAGGDAEALAQVINEAVQAGVGIATTASMKNLETALAAQSDQFFKEVLPEQLRKHSISTTVQADNPAYSNPALQPMIKALEAQLAIKHPTATPAEITQFTKDYMLGASKEILAGTGMQIVETASTEAAKTAKEPQDWASYFGV